jgi:TetR/AcrR family transcriptional regulator
MNVSTPMAMHQNKRVTSRSLQRDETRKGVIDAAIMLFARQGFEGTGLPAIAGQSGVPVPLIIYHFKTKELLWRAAVDTVFARVETHLESYRAAIESSKGIEFYRISARAHVTALATYPEYMRIVFQEGTQASDRLTWLVETHQNRITEMLMAIIGRAQAEGLAPVMDLAHAKFIYSGAFCLPIVLAPEYFLVTRQDSQSESFIEAHIDACLRLLLPTVDWTKQESRA